MQMTDDPSPLPRAPSRGFRDKPQRNYNAFDRLAPIFSTNVNDVRKSAFATALRCPGRLVELDFLSRQRRPIN